jgi:VWFA-related protein
MNLSALVPALVVAVTGVAISATPAAQDQPIFRSSVRTVPVYATVLDSTGRLVPDLVQTDFALLDNGKPAEISLFSSEPQPFTAVVMMDTSASMTANLKTADRAAEQFLLRLLPVDRAQVGAFNDKIQMSGTFTNDRDELIAALDDLYFGNPTRFERRHCGQPGRTARHRGPSRRARLHRRGGHVEPHEVWHRAGPRP